MIHIMKKFISVLKRKNIERIVNRLDKRCDYELDFGIGFCKCQSVECELFIRNNKKYVLIRQRRHNCDKNHHGSDPEWLGGCRLTLYRLIDVDKSVGYYKNIMYESNVEKDYITYFLWIKRYRMGSTSNRINIYTDDCIDVRFSRGVTGDIVVETESSVMKEFCKDNVTHRHELTEIEAGSFMTELDRFVKRAHIINYDEFKKYRGSTVEPYPTNSFEEEK